MSGTIAALLQWARAELNAVSDTPTLDAEILLAHVLRVGRSYLLAFAERELTAEEADVFENLIAQRKQHLPIAYLTGHREFWSLDLVVTPDTLIPRPETELLVEKILEKIRGDNKTIADLGTGSGAIALALAHEKPNWKIYATDASERALDVARLNATKLQLSNIIFQQGIWCAALPSIKFDAIVSNPPYIASDDPHLQQGSLRHEPQSALVADEQGLSDIRQIISSATQYLLPGGMLFLEHGAEQGALVRSIFSNFAYTSIESDHDLAGLERVTHAVWSGDVLVKMQIN